jgi:hypothetical protein
MLIYKNWWLQVMIALRKSNLKCFCTCNSVKKILKKIEWSIFQVMEGKTIKFIYNGGIK